MSAVKFGVTGIGNALVDILATTTDDFLDAQDAQHGMKRGSMNLIDQPRAIELYDAMGPARQVSGGSAANTMAAFASLGGKGAYIGKVADDQLGAIFSHDMNAIGTHYDIAPLTGGPETGRCMIFVAPDGQRTMNTFLGAAVELGPDDIDEELIAASAVTYLEGYLYDPPLAMQAFQKAATIAHRAGRKVSLSLSDPFCVARHRDEFLDLVDNHVDILFGNEEEIISLYQVRDWSEVPALVKDKCDIVILTRSEKGSVIFKDGEAFVIAAEPVAKVADTTGAGDAYAAGFLFGYTQGLPMEECGRIASIAAAEVISHIGPRPEQALSGLIARKAA